MCVVAGETPAAGVGVDVAAGVVAVVVVPSAVTPVDVVGAGVALLAGVVVPGVEPGVVDVVVMVVVVVVVVVVGQLSSQSWSPPGP